MSDVTAIHPEGTACTPVIHTEGMPAISRGSSEAKTHGNECTTRTDPEGVAVSASSATLSGSNTNSESGSGGALRDPRLMAEIPPGSGCSSDRSNRLPAMPHNAPRDGDIGASQ